MSKEKLTKARELIDDGLYRDARAALKGVKDPAADRLLQEIDDLDGDDRPPRRGRGRDILHVLVLGLLLTVLFGGAGFLIASQQGIVVGGDDAPAASGQAVAAAPQPTAPPTEIPCDADTWWAASGAAFSTAMNDALDLSIQTPPQTIQARQTAFQSWQAEFESAQLAPCLVPVQQAAAAAAPSIDAWYAQHLTPSTDQTRAQALVTMMDGLLPLADAVGALQVTTDPWIATVQNFTSAACPVDRWVVERFVGRDYPRFLTLRNQVDLQNAPLAQTQDLLRDVRALSSAYETDSAAFPECVKTASDHYLRGMNEYITAVNSVLNGSVAEAQARLGTSTSEIASFFTELQALTPTVAQPFINNIPR